MFAGSGIQYVWANHLAVRPCSENVIQFACQRLIKETYEQEKKKPIEDDTRRPQINIKGFWTAFKNKIPIIPDMFANYYLFYFLMNSMASHHYASSFVFVYPLYQWIIKYYYFSLTGKYPVYYKEPSSSCLFLNFGCKSAVKHNNQRFSLCLYFHTNLSFCCCQCYCFCIYEHRLG